MDEPDARQPDIIELEGTLHRPDRRLRAVVFMAVLLVFASQLGPTTIGSVVAFGVVGVMLLRIALSKGGAWNEAIRFRIGSDGLQMIRADRSRPMAAWRYFDDARIDSRPRRRNHFSTERWRLTLVNAFRPSIGSFLHTRSAEQTVFYAPVVIEFDAAAEQMQRVFDIVQTNIRTGQSPPTRSLPTRPAPDPASLFQLQSCMKCDYLLTGLGRDGLCPECGWSFDHRMFVLAGDSVGGRILIMGMAGGAIGLVLSLMAAGLGASGLAMGLIVGASGIAGSLWWSSMAAARQFKKRILIAAAGVEVWRGGTKIAQYAWDELIEFRTVRTDAGRLRLAAWNHQKWHISFNAFFETWRTLPPGPPVVDVLIDGPLQAAQLWCDEIERRRHNGVRIPPVVLHP